MAGRSEAYLEGPARRIVGGSSSPARSTLEMAARPVVLQGGIGAHVWDVDGRMYLDYLQSFGPGILGHGHPGVEAAVRAVTLAGPIFGTHHVAEGRLAEALAEAAPALERVRFVASGTEAVMSAIRLARAVTGRSRVVKFDAGYHGHSDPVLGHTGSAAAHASGGHGHVSGGSVDARDVSLAEETAGVPPAVTADTVTLPWNDAGTLRAFTREHGGHVACVLAEPIAGNIGIVPPDADFVDALNETRHSGSLLVADEVVSAFRFRYGDASAQVGLEPDLFCLGKIIGGGFPIGAYGGRADLMGALSPEGAVFQAGTYAGHPVAMSAGRATLYALSQPGVYDDLTDKAARLADGLVGRARAAGVEVTLSRVGPGFTLWPGRVPSRPVRTLADVQATDALAFAHFYRAFVSEGILLAPSRYEAWFVTLAHTAHDIAETLEKADRIFGVWPKVDP